jgi:hypothetical protein
MSGSEILPDHFMKVQFKNRTIRDAKPHLSSDLGRGDALVRITSRKSL